MKMNPNIWVIASIAIIWSVVLITSLNSPDLVFGDAEPVMVRIAAIANWFWGVLATGFVLRATIFRRPTEAGWKQTESWPWIMVVVGAIWLIAMFVSLQVPDVVVSETISVPVAAIVAPIIAAVLTLYAAEFLVNGFAARNAPAPRYQ